MARTERDLLCDDALERGSDAPTLCEGWDVKDLVVHLLLREGNLLAAAGAFVSPLSGLTERAGERLGKRDFAVLVERLRGGPPVWSPLTVPALDGMVNTLEYFVHHEDIRRAGPQWQPRELPSWQQNLLWKQVALVGRGTSRRTGVGVAMARTDTGEEKRLAGGEPLVVVRGLPSEVTMFLYGRKDHAQIELDGPPDAVRAVRGSELGV